MSRQRKRGPFWSYVIPEPNSGCWLWSGNITGNGYGSFRDHDGLLVAAHQRAYAL